MVKLNIGTIRKSFRVSTDFKIGVLDIFIFQTLKFKNLSTMLNNSALPFLQDFTDTG